MGGGLTRRELVAAGAAAATAAALGSAPAQARAPTLRHDFSSLPDGDGWGDAWRSVGVANLRREGGQGVLEAGSDVFPDDPRPVAFLLDRRVVDAEIEALLTHPGYAAGVVLRRVGHRRYYAAVYDTEAGELRIVRRSPAELSVLASTPVLAARAPLRLALRAAGTRPTLLAATLRDAGGRSFAAEGSDSQPELQQPGDPGVLATAQTFLTEVEERFAPFGNLRLGMYGLQEGEALQPAIEGYHELVEERSTARFASIEIRSAEQPRPTTPSVVAATTGAPLPGGARVSVAADAPADVLIDVSERADFRGARTLRPGRTGELDALHSELTGLPAGTRVHWRARLRRGGAESAGPVRSFLVPPQAGDGQPFRLAIVACGSNFGACFDHLAARPPDALVWDGDLNYPDTHGPLAQTVSAYAGIWRDFLCNPRLEPVLARASFATQRDDHDYGIQDANAADRQPPEWGIRPWDALMGDRVYYSFPAGAAEVWVLDQRRFKSAATLPDTPEKTLLGIEQRDWLMRTLAESPAPFKVVCSPCTLHHGDNARDGNWGSGFNAERDLILDHVAGRVGGRTIFVTGDTHDTMVYDRDGVFEVRACPVSIPDPRDHPGLAGFGTPAEGYVSDGIVYADPRSHFTLLETRAEAGRSVLDVTVVREDGAEPYAKRFEEQPAG